MILRDSETLYSIVNSYTIKIVCVVDFETVHLHIYKKWANHIYLLVWQCMINSSLQKICNANLQPSALCTEYKKSSRYLLYTRLSLWSSQLVCLKVEYNWKKNGRPVLPQTSHFTGSMYTSFLNRSHAQWRYTMCTQTAITGGFCTLRKPHWLWRGLQPTNPSMSLQTTKTKEQKVPKP